MTRPIKKGWVHWVKASCDRRSKGSRSKEQYNMVVGVLQKQWHKRLAKLKVW